MKIIDLLNKIANGEEVPKFWWNGCIHQIEKDYTGKISINDTYCKRYKKIELEDLNEEIKFIEEDKKIEKIQEKFSLDFIYCNLNDTAQEEINKTINSIYDKINEIIDEVNKLKENKNGRLQIQQKDKQH